MWRLTLAALVAPATSMQQPSGVWAAPSPPAAAEVLGGVPGIGQCEVETSGPICLGDQILLPPALPSGLVGYWTFDDSMPMDSSGLGSHGTSAVAAAPPFGLQGSSAAFHQNFLLIPGTEALNLQDFSYTFWTYLVEHNLHSGVSRLCPLMRKGLDSSQRAAEGGPLYASSPAVFYHRDTKQLHVEIATTVDDIHTQVEGFESNSRLSLGRWYHIAVVRLSGQRKTRLYVNGVLDTTSNTNGLTKASNEPLYIGGDPTTQNTCDMPVYIDELKVYDRFLDPDEIQAEASPALSGVEPSFVRLACTDCSLETAQANCPDGYHICDSLELHMGGYQVARSLGWLDHSTHVWSHEPDANRGLHEAAAAHGLPVSGAGGGFGSGSGGGVDGVYGLGLCCSDSSTSDA